jgi:hypothetical protein
MDAAMSSLSQVRDAIQRGQAALVKRVSDKLDLMGWALFRDEVLPTLPMEMRANIDEDEYLAMKVRLLETLDRCLLKPVTEEGAP